MPGPLPRRRPRPPRRRRRSGAGSRSGDAPVAISAPGRWSADASQLRSSALAARRAVRAARLDPARARGQRGLVRPKPRQGAPRVRRAVSADYGALGYYPRGRRHRHERRRLVRRALRRRPPRGRRAAQPDRAARRPAPEPRGGAPRGGGRSPPRGRPPSRQLHPAPAAASGVPRVGSRVSANWQMLGYGTRRPCSRCSTAAPTSSSVRPAQFWRNSSARKFGTRTWRNSSDPQPSAGTTTATRSARRRGGDPLRQRGPPEKGSTP